ncbi:MAG: homoserine O-acetyltransferase [Spirochaetia bacterium]|nr:homoserine O-acetyltransferase [Spirochaetia bacterium]
MSKKKENNIGLVETHYFNFSEPSNEFILESGVKLDPATIAYETYGKLNSKKTNAILIAHAFSGDAHAAGYHKGEKKPGWWDNMIGPGKAFDTEKYFIICSNVLGGCKGSSGPATINPKTKKAYGVDFPFVTIADMVNAQKLLIDHLGIKKLLSIAGGSMGGMQALQWMVSYPEAIRSAIPIATTAKHSPMQIAFNEVGRQAIMADPHWKEGNYYDDKRPLKGLSVARMVGHITYMSENSMDNKFGRKLKSNRGIEKFTADFEVEGYLQYRGDSFTRRFDPNSYLYITKAMDLFDAGQGKSLHESLKELKANVLVLAFKSDWLYPTAQSKEIVKACKMAGVNATFCEIDSNYGHDAFLLEIEKEAHLIKHFLQKILNEID